MKTLCTVTCLVSIACYFTGGVAAMLSAPIVPVLYIGWAHGEHAIYKWKREIEANF